MSLRLEGKQFIFYFILFHFAPIGISPCSDRDETSTYDLTRKKDAQSNTLRKIFVFPARINKIIISIKHLSGREHRTMYNAKSQQSLIIPQSIVLKI